MKLENEQGENVKMKSSKASLKKDEATKKRDDLDFEQLHHVGALMPQAAIKPEQRRSPRIHDLQICRLALSVADE